MQEFEKRYDGATVEKEMQKKWQDEETYRFVADKSRPLYSIDTPPPTVNGKLHIGHIFSYTQAEMIARYRRMRGYNVFYPFGFDDNGLPSERLVEKESGVKAKDLPRSEFIKKCIDTTQKYEAEFKDLWQSMGFSCDWNLQYSTISETSQKLSQQSFIELAKAGQAYIKESPVLWCTECQTSIAQAELETKESDSRFNYIPFYLTAEEGKYIEIATTRPELLYGVVCVFVNPEDERYKKYVGTTVRVPLYDFEVPIIADEKAAIDKGTGAVMCATFGDTTDADWVAEYNLPYKQVMMPDGTINPKVPFVGGLYVKKARKEIIALLEEKGLMLKSEPIKHMVAVHERCGTDVEIIPSRQWYIDVLSKKDELLAAGDKINWYPASMKNRYVNWVSNLKWDWCISRQRYFGVPFPVWYCKECGEPHFAKIEDLPVNPLETKYEGICHCGCTEFTPDNSVLDTWATSSITPLINRAKAKEVGIEEADFMPMSMRTQAHEIIRTWAFYTIAKSLYHTGDIPWNDAMICGFVLAKPGEKISKSKSNAKLTPQALVEEYSADAIRYWAASARLGTDTFFDQQEMQDASKRIMTKLWNSSKFVLSHLQDYDPSYKPTLLPIDKWIVERTNETIRQVEELLDQYEIGLARKTVDDLFWKDLCDNYIEIVKERLYQPELHGYEERRSAQSAIYYCLYNILKMYAIYIPHITEYIYLKGFKDFEGDASIHTTVWPTVETLDQEALDFGEEIKNVVFEMRKIKSDMNVSVRTEMEELVVHGSEKFADAFKLTEKDIIACSHAKCIKYELN